MSTQIEPSSSSSNPCSTLVNIAEHAELRLIRILSAGADKTLLSPTFESDCESHIVNADAPGLIRAIIRDKGAVKSLFDISPVEDSVSAFSLLAALLDRVGDVGIGKEAILTSELADAVSADGYDSSKRIAMLCALYNLRLSGLEKTALLGRIVTICGDFDSEKLMEGGELWDVLEAENVEKMINGWTGVGLNEKRALYRSIREAYRKVKGGAVRMQRYLILDVSTYLDQADLDSYAITAAQEVAIGAIRDPVTLFTLQRGMLSLPAIAALKTDPATEPLYTLLQILQEGKLTDFQSHLQAQPNLLATYSLSPTTLTHNMRLLSLCSLASEHEEIPYSAIAQTLQISLDEVESWVVNAVSKDLISAKMDQLSQVVMVERCVVRKFGSKEWRMLKSRLDFWKSNVRSVLEGLKAGQDVSGMM